MNVTFQLPEDSKADLIRHAFNDAVSKFHYLSQISTVTLKDLLLITQKESLQRAMIENELLSRGLRGMWVNDNTTK